MKVNKIVRGRISVRMGEEHFSYPWKSQVEGKIPQKSKIKESSVQSEESEMWKLRDGHNWPFCWLWHQQHHHS